MDVQSPPGSRGYAEAPARAKRRKRSFWRRTAWPLLKLAVLVVILAALANAAVFRIGRPLRLLSREYRETHKLQSQVAALKRDNTSLEQRIKHLQTPQGAEVAARKLGYVKPGEVTLVVPNASTKHSANTPR